ncbi:TetR/AcrR family transcriptional regulator [Phaeacidiphilus oryzae]|uniref:TetR/AcrR family transcriptional regulator n=1 Tax=Phaeacidiphilus oryzae TaxID=348818 RepID=UPI000A027F62|nr:TetR/AcrR family transcriptional regulator [Phaeacidiphilus oryzae]
MNGPASDHDPNEPGAPESGALERSEREPGDREPGGKAARPGGRSARVVAAVHQAVVELIAELGAEEVTIPLVAARAGVNPTTVYRRWGDMQHLLEAVALHRLRPQDPAPDTGDLGADLHEWAQRTLVSITLPDSQALLRGAVARGDSWNACIRSRAGQIESILEASLARDEAPPSLERVLDHVVAPIYFRVLIGPEPASPAYVHHLVDEMLAGTAPERSRPTPES